MSQMSNNAFAKVPDNPYTKRVQEAKAAGQLTPADSPIDQLRQDAGLSPTSAPTAIQNPLPQSGNPAPADSSSNVPPVFTPSPAEQPSNPMPPLPPLNTLPVQPQQGVDPQLFQRLQAERDAAAQEAHELRQALANLSAQNKQQMRQNAVEQVFNDEFLESLETIDASDARKIGGAMYDAMAGTIDGLREDIRRQQQIIEQNAQTQQQQAVQQQIARLNSEVERYHPDFQQIMATKEFRDFLAQRDGYSSETRDQRALREYQNGNSAYVIGLLYDFKGQRHNVQNVMSVAPSNAPSHTDAPTSGTDAPKYTLRELNDLYTMRRIDLDTYKSELQKLKPTLAAQFNR